MALLLFVAAPLEDLLVPEEGVAFEEDLLAEGVEEEAGWKTVNEFVDLQIGLISSSDQVGFTKR